MEPVSRIWQHWRAGARIWWQRGKPMAVNVAYLGTSGDDLLDRVADGELLAAHALRHGLPAAAADLALLQGARARLAVLRADAAQCDLLIGALQRVSAASGRSAAEIRAMEGRLRRLWPELADARRLLYFATARGTEVKPEVAQPIVDAVLAAQNGSLDAQVELKFLAAYQLLAAKVTPVTAATLNASQTRLPKWADLVLQPQLFIQDYRDMTLGRFVHLFFFTLVLVATGAAIAYQSVGEAALAKYQALGKRLEAVPLEHRKLKALERERQTAYFTLQQRKDARPDELLLADQRLMESADDVRLLEDQQRTLVDERSHLPATIAAWAAKPCETPPFGWICERGNSSTAMDDERLFSAQMVLKRMDSIVLPMLLGLLGSYAFVLRSISQEIRQFAFEEYSVLHHVVRLALGAVAGVAAGWLLKPEQIGLLNSVPAWVLAFVAGYGIELVFSFLDRLVGSFTSKPPANGG